MGCLGCLKNIVTWIVLVLALIGFINIGGWDFCKEKYQEHQVKKETRSEIKSETRSPFERNP